MKRGPYRKHTEEERQKDSVEKFIRTNKNLKPNSKKEAEVRDDVIRIMKANPIVAHIVSKAVEAVMVERIMKEEAGK